MTNDDINLLLDTSSLDLFSNPPPEPLPTTVPPHPIVGISEVKNEARCINRNETLLKCEQCSKTFKKLFNYKRHMIIHKNEFPYKCDYCQQEFKDESNCKKHLKLCKIKHNIGSNDTEPVKRKCISKNTSNIKIYKFKCETCGKMFYKKYNLTRHENMHKLNESKNGEIENNLSYYECKLCNKMFNELKQLNLHEKNWHKSLENEIECNFCKEKFNFKHNLFIHKLNCKESASNNNNAKQNFRCNLCKKNFTKIYNLNRHMAARHENNVEKGNVSKKYICEYCSKAFYEYNKLKLHVNSCKFSSNS